VKFLIVAAGRGSRLEEYGQSKPLVKLRGKPILQHVVETIASVGDIGAKPEIVIVTGWNHNKINELVAKLNQLLPVQISTVHNDDWEKGNGTSVSAAGSVIDEPFILLMADHIVDPQILQVLQNSNLDDADLLLAVDYNLDNPMVDLDDVTRVQSNGKHIAAIAKHLETYNCFDTGCFLCSPAMFTALGQAQKNNNDYGISGGVTVLASQQRACVVDIGQARWVDVDTPEMLEKALGILNVRDS